jgi:cell wall-associated NlpC family hydrolase
MLKRKEIIASAEKYLGTNYVYQGNTVFGIDCIGLIYRTFADLGVEVEYPRTYNKEEHYTMNTWFRDRFNITLRPKEGDIMTFHNGQGLVHHAAFFISEEKIIHSIDDRRNCVHYAPMRFWKDKVYEVYDVMSYGKSETTF